MSALTDLFSSMANKIRSKTGTATTYTPPQMVSDGIDDVFDAGVASATTSITPSDSSPVAMSANTGYKPTTAGYAIASNPTSITPSNSSPVALASGDINKMGGAGYAIESYASVTPSSTPKLIPNDGIAKFNASGYIVNSVTSVTPSNSSPVSLSSGSIYKMGGNGKAVASITDVTPSATPTAVSSGDVVKIGGSGKIVDTITDITPGTTYANSPYLWSGEIYKSTDSGRAVQDLEGVTPSDTSPATLARYHAYILPGDYIGFAYLYKNPIGILMTSPDISSNGNIAANGTRSITVTKKPRFMVVTRARYGTDKGQSQIFIVDVTNENAKNLYYNGSDYGSNTTNVYSDVVSSASSSSVVIKGATYTVRSLVYMWY